MATIGELLTGAVERLRASGSESPRLDAELLLAHALGVDRTTLIAHPELPVGPEPASRFAETLRAPGGRRAGRLHPRAQGVPRRRLRRRRPGAHPAAGDRAAGRPRAGRDRRPAGPRPAARRDAAARDRRRRHRQRRDRRRPRGGAATPRHARRGGDRRLGRLGGRGGPGPRERGRPRRGGPRGGRRHADLLPPPGRVAGLLVVPARFDVVCANLPYIPVRRRPADCRSPPRSSRSDALDGGPDGLDVIRRLLDVLPERLAPGGVGAPGDRQRPGRRPARGRRRAARRLGRAGGARPGRPSPRRGAGAPRGRAARVVIGRRIRLVALDLDGTLIGDDLRLPPRTAATIRAVVATGVARRPGHRPDDELGPALRPRARAAGAAGGPAGRARPRDARAGEPTARPAPAPPAAGAGRRPRRDRVVPRGRA